jgi:hypothetical protein
LEDRGKDAFFICKWEWTLGFGVGRCVGRAMQQVKTCSIEKAVVRKEKDKKR